jgi:hypothetical protein
MRGRLGLWGDAPPRLSAIARAASDCAAMRAVDPRPWHRPRLGLFADARPRTTSHCAGRLGSCGDAPRRLPANGAGRLGLSADARGAELSANTQAA